MKTIMKIALILSAIAFATVANATTPAFGGSPTTAFPVVTTTENQIDFVTVGSTMPYAVEVGTTNFATWEAAVRTAFDLGAGTPLPGGTIGTQTTWTLGSLSFTGNSIYVQWPSTPGEHVLQTSTITTINGVDAGCDATTSSRTVFVLPQPSVIFSDAVANHGNQAILGCDADEHTVRFLARGIGERRVTYTVFRRPLGTGGTYQADRPVNAGTAESDPDWFEGNDFNETRDLYEAESVVAGAAEIAITVNDLQPGYIYTVVINTVSDQISRKSFETGYAFVQTDVQAVFAVVPAADAATIQHVSNTP